MKFKDGGDGVKTTASNCLTLVADLGLTFVVSAVMLGAAVWFAITKQEGEFYE